MHRLTTALAAAMIFTAPAQADEIEDIINSLMEIYQSGDHKLFAEETDYLNQLAQELAGADFGGYLPAALPPWSFELMPPDPALAMLGGGVQAKGRYTNGNESFTITLMADNQMVNAMTAMFTSTAMLASQGEVFRIGRDKFVMSDREVKGMLGKVLVQSEGDNPIAQRAHIETMPIDEIKAY